MIRSFVFSQGKLLSQDHGVDFLNVALHEDDVQIWVDLQEPTAEESQLILDHTFKFHPLAIEDCVAVTERPKVDDYEGYLFMVIHAVDFTQLSFRTNELNLFIGKNFLVTYHDQPVRSITSTIERVQKNPTAIARAPDRLTYYLLELLLENYDPALENLASAISKLEHQVLASESTDILASVMSLKDQVQHLRQIIAPQREVIARIAHGEFKLVRAHLLPYYRDLFDRLVRIADAAENYRDSLSDVLQFHFHVQQTQANRVIKVLTVLATLSIPFVGIASYYGMNFEHMPELAWRHGPLFMLGVTGFLTGIIFWLLKRNNWL
jgi:magnesium transporter